MVKVAIYDNFASIATFSEYKQCELLAIPKRYDVTQIAMAFQKDSPYQKLFDYHLNVGTQFIGLLLYTY